MWSLLPSCACHTFLRSKAGPSIAVSLHPLHACPTARDGSLAMLGSFSPWGAGKGIALKVFIVTVISPCGFGHLGEMVPGDLLAAWGRGERHGGIYENVFESRLVLVGCAWFGMGLGSDTEHLCAVTRRMCPALGGCRLVRIGVLGMHVDKPRT